MAERKHVVDRLGFTFIVLFLALHLLGARYLYSFVPYDEWTQKLFGVSITEQFGFQRNHYDRLVHVCFWAAVCLSRGVAFSARGYGLPDGGQKFSLCA